MRRQIRKLHIKANIIVIALFCSVPSISVAEYILSGIDITTADVFEQDVVERSFAE